MLICKFKIPYTILIILYRVFFSKGLYLVTFYLSSKDSQSVHSTTVGFCS